MANLQSRSLLARSPLLESVLERTVPEFTLRELENVAQVRVQALRSRGMDKPAANPPQLPNVPNTSCGTDPIALWKAPDDWLVYSQVLTTEALSRWIATVTSEAPLIVTDVSCASVVLELGGPRALDVLLRDCPLDIEGNAIPPGACAQTLFAQTSVIIHRPTKPGSWHLFIERSVAIHVWEWLLITAAKMMEPYDGGGYVQQRL
jgi:sarcosine oxidase, subunit gamma